MDKGSEAGVVIPPRAEGHVDVRQIMAQIDSAIHHKQKEGIYLDLELDREVELALRDLIEGSDVDSELAGQLGSVGREWNIKPDYQVVTHRQGAAVVVVWIKRLIRPVIRLYTDYLIHRQSQLNSFLVHSIRGLARELVLSRRDRRELKYKATVLEREVHRLRQRLEDQGVELKPEILPGGGVQLPEEIRAHKEAGAHDPMRPRISEDPRGDGRPGGDDQTGNGDLERMN